LDKNIL